MNDDPCAICLDNVDLRQNTLELDCNHHFHVECIVDWNYKRRGCPLCRRIPKSTRRGPFQSPLQSPLLDTPPTSKKPWFSRIVLDNLKRLRSLVCFVFRCFKCVVKSNVNDSCDEDEIPPPAYAPRTNDVQLEQFVEGLQATWNKHFQDKINKLNKLKETIRHQEVLMRIDEYIKEYERKLIK
jgi:hypothetical protein